jgi:hypothetical protein
MPPNKERFTFLVTKARLIATSDGIIDKKDGSMAKTLSLKV